MEPFNAQTTLLNRLWETWLTPALYCLTKVEIAEHLKEGPLPISKLSKLSNTHAATLFRLMRALSSVDIFKQVSFDKDPEFENTPLSTTLRPNVKGSIHDVVLFFAEPWHWRIFEQMESTLKDGEPAFDKTHGCSVFDYLKTHPDAALTFDKAMTGFTDVYNDIYVEAFDFTGLNQIIDIAGGHGSLLASLLKRYPHLKATLFDLDHVISQAKKETILNSHLSQVSFKSGSFFEPLPKGFDAYLMKSILHDWDDESCKVILTQIKNVMSSKARLLVFERVIPSDNLPFDAKLTDIEMLMCTPKGKERTEREFTSLFESVGLILHKIHKTSTSRSVLEVKVSA